MAVYKRCEVFFSNEGSMRCLKITLNFENPSEAQISPKVPYIILL